MLAPVPRLSDCRIEHDLASRFAELRRVRNRQALEASDIWTELESEIHRVTHGLEVVHTRSTRDIPDRRFVRVACWNIERGLRVDDAITFIRAHEHLSSADLLLLSEVDIGMARTRNRNVARDIATALDYDYVFGNSYLVMSPGNDRDGDIQGENQLGLHGNAILSRLPLRRAGNVPLYIAKDKFHSSEKRLGCKKALWAEVETPGGPLNVSSVHLDSGASPEGRMFQLRDLLHAIDQTGGSERVLVGGDLNSTTYDLQSPMRLVRNVLAKLFRGGFPHAIEHYMRPYDLYERPVFDLLAEHGYDFRSFNDMEAPTTRYRVREDHAESKIRDHLPGLIVSLLRWKLRPWGGVAPMKLDWFAGKGLEAAVPDQIPGTVAPRAIEEPIVAGRRVSDHDPLVLDVV